MIFAQIILSGAAIEKKVHTLHTIKNIKTSIEIDWVNNFFFIAIYVFLFLAKCYKVKSICY